jgi:hypothetical protein
MAGKEKVQIEVEVPTKNLHVNHAACPNGHLLQDDKVKIHGDPALKVNIKIGSKEGILYIDPVYGRYDNKVENITLKKGDVVEMFCPECGVNLGDPNDTCQLCSSPMFIFHLPRGGIIEGCTKNGCVFHKLKIVDAEKQVSRLFENSTMESYL